MNKAWGERKRVGSRGARSWCTTERGRPWRLHVLNGKWVLDRSPGHSYRGALFSALEDVLPAYPGRRGAPACAVASGAPLVAAVPASARLSVAVTEHRRLSSTVNERPGGGVGVRRAGVGAANHGLKRARARAGGALFRITRRAMRDRMGERLLGDNRRGTAAQGRSARGNQVREAWFGEAG